MSPTADQFAAEPERYMGSCDHEWEPMPIGNGERCAHCGETRDPDYDLDDGRDFTPPYEP